MNGYLLMARCLYEDCPLEMLHTFVGIKDATQKWIADPKGLLRTINSILDSDITSVYSLACVEVRCGRVARDTLKVLHAFTDADPDNDESNAPAPSVETAPKYKTQDEPAVIRLASTPKTTDINIHVVVDEHGDFGLGDTSENAHDNYNDCFGEGKCRSEVCVELSVPLPQILKANA